MRQRAVALLTALLGLAAAVPAAADHGAGDASDARSLILWGGSAVAAVVLVAVRILANRRGRRDDGDADR